MDQPASLIEETRAILEIFAALDIPYAIGGSIASSIHGIDRFTRDADMTVEPFPGKEGQLVASLQSNYYISLPAIEEALRSRTSFNIINTSTGYKADIFVRTDAPFEASALQRRLKLSLPDRPNEPLAVLTPEDTILYKLRWYRLGEETSEQQWRDVLGVMKVQSGKLDEAYLDRWAPEIGVADLLARARGESAQ
jgi:hypothetical protein